VREGRGKGREETEKGKGEGRREGKQREGEGKGREGHAHIFLKLSLILYALRTLVVNSNQLQVFPLKRNITDIFVFQCKQQFYASIITLKHGMVMSVQAFFSRHSTCRTIDSFSSSTLSGTTTAENIHSLSFSLIPLDARSGI